MTEETKQIKIMLVDDDKFLLDMYLLKFKTNGISLETFPESEKALEKLRSGYAPDIILLDIIMPVMDGLELLKTIRNEKLAPSATVIMLTNQPEEMDKAKELGAVGYIIKATNIPSEVVSEVLDIYNKNKK